MFTLAHALADVEHRGARDAGHPVRPCEARDRLLRLAEAARAATLRLLGVERVDATIDVFFIERRAQMDSLVGVPVTDAATGYAGQNEALIHFGLGGAAGVDSLVVAWPSGHVDRFGTVEARSTLVIREADGMEREQS